MKHMENKRIHTYTVLQIFFFSLIFVVQNIKAISILFPFMTLLCIPARIFFLPKFLEGWELLLLDGEDENIEEWLEAKRDSIMNPDFQPKGSDKKMDKTDEVSDV